MPKKPDAPGEEIKKSSGNLDDTEKPLVTTIDTVDKEGNIDTAEKKGNKNLMSWRKPSFIQFQQKEDLHSKQYREITNRKK